MGRPREWTPERILALSKELEAYYNSNPDKMFWESFYETRPDISKDVVRHICGIDEAFSRTIKKLNDIQEQRLVEAMVKQKINVVAGIFVLKNKHNWADKQEVKQESRQTIVDLRELKGLSEDDLKEEVRKLTEDAKA